MCIMFKRNFERICAQKGVAPSTVMRRCGMAAATYSCWSDDTVPRQSTVKRLAEHLGCTIDDLLADEPQDEKSPPAEAGGLGLSAYPENIRKCVQAALQIPPEYREDFLRTVEALVRASKPDQ